MTNNIRFDAVCGLLANDKGMSLCFNERGDSNGFDFTFLSLDGVEKKISLNDNEVQYLAIAAVAAGRLNLDNVMAGVERLLSKPSLRSESNFTFSTAEPTTSEKVVFSFDNLKNVLEKTSFHLRAYIPDSTTRDLRIMPTYTNSDWSQLTIGVDGSNRKLSLVFKVDQMVDVKVENIPSGDVLKLEITNLFFTYFEKKATGSFDSFCISLATLCLRYLHQ